MEKLGKYMVGISRTRGEHVALARCTGMVNAVNAATVLSRCFPDTPETAKFWKAGPGEYTVTPDSIKPAFSLEELEAVREALRTIDKEYAWA